jgi:hypothetical protein
MKTVRKVRVRGIALPNEHGAWGFLFEPLVAAIVVAPSAAAGWIFLLVVGAFFTRQPLRILLSDWTANQYKPQTSVALKFVFLYGSVFCLGLIGSLWFAGIRSLVPFILIIPFAAYQVYCDVSHKSRQLLPELTGAIAISSSAAVIALAGGWTTPAAFALWAIFAARLIPSIVYVRNRLRLEKGKDYSMSWTIAAHLIALGTIGFLVGNGLGSKLTLAMFVVLLARASIGLSSYRKKQKAMKIGIWEVIYGVMTVLTVIGGYYAQF